MRRKIDPANVLARLAVFHRLERKATDEAGWIALAYGCSRAEANSLILAARKTAEGKGTA